MVGGWGCARGWGWEEGSRGEASGSSEEKACKRPLRSLALSLSRSHAQLGRAGRDSTRGHESARLARARGLREGLLWSGRSGGGLPALSQTAELFANGFF